jgi:CheY-like chemotaxis protein
MASILMVDDSEEVRRAMRRVLERLGHDVTTAGDGKEALAALAGGSCDLVVTDLNMPGMDGIELILAVKERWPEVPVIAVSGGGLMPKEILLANAEVLGAVTTLAKPLGILELEAAVNQALAAAGNREGPPSGA